MFQTAQRTIDVQKKYIAALANENSLFIKQLQAARARKPTTAHAEKPTEEYAENVSLGYQDRTQAARARKPKTALAVSPQKGE